MSHDEATESEPSAPWRGRKGEMVAFLLLAFGVWPIVAVMVVGGYGFLVWIYQMLTGPPGPPGH